MSKKALVLLYPQNEENEIVIPVQVLRRAGVSKLKFEINKIVLLIYFLIENKYTIWFIIIFIRIFIKCVVKYEI